MTTLVKRLKTNIRMPYAWPGGYEIVAVMDDGEILCMDCCKNNYREILDSTLHDIEDGWKLAGFMMEAVSPDCCTDDLISYCAHCNKVFGEMG